MPDEPLPPDGPAAPALLRAALDLSARLLTVEAAAGRVRHAADDEAVHDFRVASRRLTASIDLWAPALEAEASARARRRLRSLRRDLSPVRDLEVLAAGYRGRLDHAAPAARVVLERRLARIGRRLARLTRNARRVVTRERLESVRRNLLRALRRAPPPAVTAAALAEARVAATSERARAALRAAWERGDAESLHEGRIRLKAWRYACEIAEELPLETRPGAARLRDVQEALGTVQDLTVMEGDLARLLRRARRRERPELAATIEALLGELAAERNRAAAETQRLSTTLSVAAMRVRPLEA